MMGQKNNKVVDLFCKHYFVQVDQYSFMFTEGLYREIQSEIIEQCVKCGVERTSNSVLTKDEPEDDKD